MSDTTLIHGGTIVTAEREWRGDVDELAFEVTLPALSGGGTATAQRECNGDREEDAHGTIVSITSQPPRQKH